MHRYCPVVQNALTNYVSSVVNAPDYVKYAAAATHRKLYAGQYVFSRAAGWKCVKNGLGHRSKAPPLIYW